MSDNAKSNDRHWSTNTTKYSQRILSHQCQSLLRCYPFFNLSVLIYPVLFGISIYFFVKAAFALQHPVFVIFTHGILS